MKKLLLIIFVLVSSMALADWGMMGKDYSHMYSGGGYGMFMGMGMGMGLFWVVLIALSVWALTQYRKPLKPEATAKDIVQMRFARGEIDEAEMKNMLDKLS